MNLFFNPKVYDQVANRSLINQIATVLDFGDTALIGEVRVDLDLLVHVCKNVLFAVLVLGWLMAADLDAHACLFSYLSDNTLFKSLTEV